LGLLLCLNYVGLGLPFLSAYTGRASQIKEKGWRSPGLTVKQQRNTHTHTHTKIEKVADRIQRQRARSRDVGEVAAAGRAKTADERSSGPIKEAWYAFRDCLLQEQGPLLALWRVSVFLLHFKSIIVAICNT
jgi:hypothetical protein